MGKTARDQRESGTGTSTPRAGGDRRDPVYIYRRWCKGCGICAAFCPRDVLKMGQDGHPTVAQPELCTSCRLCEALCPDFGITVAPRGKGRKV